MSIPNSLQTWISNWVSKERLPADFSISMLAGDGSTRSFFRLTVPKNLISPSFIVLFDPSWTLSQDYPAHQVFLQNAGIPVPKFFAVDQKSGILVMEDLGDELLQFRIEKDPNSKISWLKKTIGIAARLHGETFPVSPNIPAATRRFDQKKYFEELCFTLEHLHSGLLKLPKLNDATLKSIETFCGEIAAIGPEVFAHRDYHCRNLLVHNEQLYMIDFQDARLGSPHYDLASLVYDAYVPISSTERNSLLELYKDSVKPYTLNDAIDWNSFASDLQLTALQRTLKAAGSFASFFTRHQKNTHLKYLVPALQYSLELRKSAGETAKLLDVLPIQNWIEVFKKNVPGSN